MVIQLPSWIPGWPGQRPFLFTTRYPVMNDEDAWRGSYLDRFLSRLSFISVVVNSSKVYAQHLTGVVHVTPSTRDGSTVTVT